MNELKETKLLIDETKFRDTLDEVLLQFQSVCQDSVKKIPQLNETIEVLKDFCEQKWDEGGTKMLLRYQLGSFFEEIMSVVKGVKKPALVKRLKDSYERYLEVLCEQECLYNQELRHQKKDLKQNTVEIPEFLKLSALPPLHKAWLLKRIDQLIKTYKGEEGLVKFKRAGNLESFSNLPYSIEKLQVSSTGKYQWFLVEKNQLADGATGKVKVCYPLFYKKGHLQMGEKHVLKISNKVVQIEDIEDMNNERKRVELFERQQNKPVTHAMRHDVKEEVMKFRYTQEFHGGPDLLGHILKGTFKHMSLGRKILVCKQIAEQLNIIYGNDWVHRDIKLENILLHIDQETGKISIKIIDLGSVAPREPFPFLKEGAIVGLTGHYVAPNVYIPKEGKPGEWEFRLQHVHSDQDIFAVALVFAAIFSSHEGENYSDAVDYYRNSPIFKERIKIPEVEEMSYTPVDFSFDQPQYEEKEKDLLKKIEDYLKEVTDIKKEDRGTCQDMDQHLNVFLHTYVLTLSEPLYNLLEAIYHKHFPNFPNEVFIQMHTILMQTLVESEMDVDRVDFDQLGKQFKNMINQIAPKSEDLGKIVHRFFSNSWSLEKEAVQYFIKDLLEKLETELTTTTELSI